LDFDEISKYITTVTFPGKILQLWNPCQALKSFWILHI
jgi:hypothetical protein